MFFLLHVPVRVWRARAARRLPWSLQPGRQHADWASFALWCAAAALLSGLLGLALQMGDPDVASAGQLTGVRIALVCVLLGALLVVPACLLTWRRATRDWLQWLTLLAAALLLLWLWHWRLLGLHFFSPS